MAKKKSNGVKGSYRFTDKDPIITVFQYLMERSQMSFARVAHEARVGESTLRNWDSGGTRYPRHGTIRAVFTVLGADEKFTLQDGRQLTIDYESASDRPFKIGHAPD